MKKFWKWTVVKVSIVNVLTATELQNDKFYCIYTYTLSKKLKRGQRLFIKKHTNKNDSDWAVLTRNNLPDILSFKSKNCVYRLIYTFKEKIWGLPIQICTHICIQMYTESFWKDTKETDNCGFLWREGWGLRDSC